MAIETAKTKLELQDRVSKFPRTFTAIFLLILIIVYSLGHFDGLDRRWTDTLFRWRGMIDAHEKISVIAMDDDSIKKVGQYPWPRRVYQKLVDGLFDAGVKVVGLDVLFIDPSRPEEDKILIDVTKRRADSVVHALLAKRIPHTQTYKYEPPFPGLKKVTKNIGTVNQMVIDLDGVVRETTLFIATEGSIPFWPEREDRVPALGLEVLSVFEGRKPDDYLKDFPTNTIRLNILGQRTFLRPLKDEDGNEVLDEWGEKLLVPTPAEFGIKRIASWKILEGKLDDEDKERLEGGIALIGFTATGAFDHFPSPFTALAPGVEVHAALIDNLLNDRWLRTCDRFVTIGLVLLMAFIGWYLTRVKPAFAGAGFLGVIAVWVYATYFFFHNLYVLEFTAPLVSFIVVFWTLLVHKMVLDGMKAREIRQMFGQYVSPEVVNLLVKDPSKIQLGGQKRDMTMFFLDIAHFTSISEKMDPENLINFLNHYLTALTENIHKNGGVVDKYIGDCIMAFWNAPLDEPGHRKKACLAAVDCVRTIERLNETYVDPSMPEKPAVRIGLNSGEVVVGNTGSAKKLAYTVLGDDVNLASRLEGANKFFGSVVMASEATYKEAADEVVARVLGSVRVVGKEVPIKVYELLARKGELATKWEGVLPAYNKGVELFLDGKFEEAKVELGKILEVFPEDKVTKLYLNACEDYIAIPPQGDWKVFNLTSK